MKTLTEIIEMIELQEEVKTLVLSSFQVLPIEDLVGVIKQLTNIETASEARNILIEKLDSDPNGIKMLTCMLYALTFTYEDYHKLNISEEIFIATMKCFTRFIEERWVGYQKWFFDRDWWAYRQIAIIIFRIGELEYEMRERDGEKCISIHIPSDSVLTSEKVNQSISEARSFFEKYYPEFFNVPYRCHSWLLSPALKELLPPSSNILKFQDLFEIVKEDYSSSGYISLVFKRHYEDYNQLPEDTTLQRNLKKFLLAGNAVSLGLGYLK